MRRRQESSRRQAISVLLTGLTAKANGLRRFLEPHQGGVVLMDVASRKVIASNGGERLQAPPGSTVKPLVLAALLRRGRLRADAAYPCPIHLTIANRKFDCTHPRLVTPVGIDAALAYSCNCFVARTAERWEPGELAAELSELHVRRELSKDGQTLQALGESGVLATPESLALAYRQLALKITAAEMQPILNGLEDAVEFGTAQNARVKGVAIAGKTGSTRHASGDPIGWFAGFMPSRAPQVVVAVMTKGRSGGGDAAPVAAEVLSAYRQGHL